MRGQRLLPQGIFLCHGDCGGNKEKYQFHVRLQDGLHQARGDARRMADKRLWNGYAEEGREKYSTPEELFCCEFAPYFMEGIKVRYPEYCRDLPAPKKQTEPTR